jgi:DNA-binding Lrp family transcriptional regulator
MTSMDHLDTEIVGCLLEDGRASYATVARQIGLSLPATKRRVDRLVDTGVIRGFTAVVDPQVMGWTLEAVVQLFPTGTVPYARMRKDLEAMPEVIEAVTVTGAADSMVRVVAKDAQHLGQVIDRLRALKYVQQTDSSMVLSTLLRRSVRELRGDSEQ